MQFSVNLLHFSHLHGNVKKKGEYNLTINGEKNLGVGDRPIGTVIISVTRRGA